MIKINLPPLNSKKTVYSDLNWISFARFEKWNCFYGYVYEMMEKNLFLARQLLQSKEIYDLVLSEINQDWQDAVLLENSQIIPTELKHSVRVAMPIELIPLEGVTPVHIDTLAKSYFKLEGHHRLLALKLLGYEVFPACSSGIVSELDFLIEV